MAIERGDPFPHPTQRCKNENCGARIMVRAQWDDGTGSWGDGTAQPMPDDKYCEKGCGAAESGAYDAA